MPILNPSKCYKQQPQRLTIAGLQTLPDNWLSEFYTLLSEQLKLNDEIRQGDFDYSTNQETFLSEKAGFFKQLDRHVGAQSSYSLKSQLLESLATLYSICLHPKTTTVEKQLIASRIAEDVNQCSPGFYSCLLIKSQSNFWP